MTISLAIYKASELASIAAQRESLKGGQHLALRRELRPPHTPAGERSRGGRGRGGEDYRYPADVWLPGGSRMTTGIGRSVRFW